MWLLVQIQSLFFSKTKPKVEKVVYFTLKCHLQYFDLVLRSRFKTKQLLRSDVGRSTDKMTKLSGVWVLRVNKGQKVCS